MELDTKPRKAWKDVWLTYQEEEVVVLVEERPIVSRQLFKSV